MKNNNDILVFIFFCAVFPSGANSTEFEFGFINGRSSSVSMSDLIPTEKYKKGVHLLDIFVNDFEKRTKILEVNKNSDIYCFDSNWLSSAGVNINYDFFSDTYSAENDCYELELNKSVNVDIDTFGHYIKFKIPQAGMLLENEKKKELNFGDTALRSTYYANAYKYTESTDYYLLSKLDLNISRWILASSFYVNNSGSAINFGTASTPIEKIKSDLNIGTFSFNNSHLGGAKINGVNLRTNQSMITDRGYKPVFSGMASSRSRVTLVQNGSVIYSEILPQGPFLINNVSVISNGDVTMEVKGDNGEVTKTVIPVVLYSGIISPGTFDYDFSIGLLDNYNHDKNSQAIGRQIISFDAGFGFGQSNASMSAIYNPDYQGIGLGYSRSFGQFGLLKSSMSASRVSNFSELGFKYEASHSVNIGDKTSVNSSIRSSNSDKYYDFGEYESVAYDDFLMKNRLSTKNQATISINHSLSNNINLSATAWTRDYWNSDLKHSGLFAFMLYRTKYANYQLSTNAQVNNVNSQYSVGLSVSIPFSLFGQGSSTAGSYSSSFNGDDRYNVGINSSINENINYYVGHSGSVKSKQNGSSLFGSYSGNRINAEASIDSDSFNGVTSSASINGTVIALPTRGKVFMSSHYIDSLAVFDINGMDANDFKLIDSNYQPNGSGELLVPLNAFRSNELTIDTSSLPIDAELITTSVNIYPAAKSIVYIPVSPIKVTRYILKITKKDGRHPVLGTWAKSDSNMLGFISSYGVLSFSSYEKPGDIIVGDCVIDGQSFDATSTIQEVECL